MGVSLLTPTASLSDRVADDTLERQDGAARGAMRYTEDLQPRDLLHGVLVRSVHAAGSVARLELDEALSVEGVVCILTAADVPDCTHGVIVDDEPLFARGVVRYVGEPIAAVCACSRVAAQEAASAVRVHVEPQSAVTRLEQALTQGAPRVHEDRPNVMEGAEIERGDVTGGFERADHIVTTRVRSHRVHQGYIEPRASLAELDELGRIIITTSTQNPFGVRDGVAKLLDVPASQVRVKVPAVGGGFGGKLHVGMAAFAAALARRTNRPVRVVSSRAEEFQAGNPREGSLVELTSAIDRSGRVLARRARVYLDSGAYALDTPAIASTAALLSCGPYRVDALHVSVSPVYTNTTPTGSFRGPQGRRWSTRTRHI